MLKHFLVFVLIFSISGGTAQELTQMDIPCFEGGADLDPLKTCNDAEFQTILLDAINSNQKWKKLARDKKLAIGLVDFRDMDQVRFAQINGNEMMYAASLPKIAILLAAMDAFDKKELTESKAIKKDLRLMISKSNNQASTRMIDRLGFSKIAAVLTDAKYKLYDEKSGGGLWVGKRYAAGGARNPDPMKGLSHAATVTQVCRFYYMMMQGKLVNEKRSQEMMTYMVDPELNHKFINTLSKTAPKARFFRKSGSWSTFHSDSVMVWGPDRRYILTALVDDPNGEMIMRELVKTAEKVLNK